MFSRIIFKIKDIFRRFLIAYPEIVTYYDKFIYNKNRFEQYLANKDFIIKSRTKLRKVNPFLDNNFFKILETILVFSLILFVFVIFSWTSPRPFPDHVLVTIDSGEHLAQVAEKFHKENVVRSSFWLKVFVRLHGGERRVIAGDYYFPTAVNIFEVTKTITAGRFGLSPIRVVIPEGLNSMEIGELLAGTLPRFDKEDFIDEARDYEGYLFPDTYFFMPNSKPQDVIALMRENFARKVNDLLPDVEKFGKPMKDVVIMASIVEDEARQIDTRRVIAGILWKRLKLNMPLQADATFKYYNGKTSFTLTKSDLEDEDNPYNTYANKGLPPTPISNPSLDSLRATVAPTNTDYLYFLSDKNGNMHYSVNFEGHKRNRELYLQ